MLSPEVSFFSQSYVLPRYLVLISRLSVFLFEATPSFYLAPLSTHPISAHSPIRSL